MKRPSSREIDLRLKEARNALIERKVRFANPAKVVGELMSLNIGDTDEVWDLIVKILKEIQIGDYAGQHPPKINYEPFGTGNELWAFNWESPTLRKNMYLKFSVADGWFYYVSLHESKFPQKGTGREKWNAYNVIIQNSLSKKFVLPQKLKERL